MVLVGAYRETTPTRRLVGYVAYGVLAVLMIPWLLISVGYIVPGFLAVVRGDTGLMIGIPAGLPLLIGPAALVYLQRRWYPPIARFTFDGSCLKYSLKDGDSQSRVIADVFAVHKGKRAKGRRIHGDYVKLRDGASLYVSRSLTNADELYEKLRGGMPDNSPNNAFNRSRGPRGDLGSTSLSAARITRAFGADR